MMNGDYQWVCQRLPTDAAGEAEPPCGLSVVTKPLWCRRGDAKSRYWDAVAAGPLRTEAVGNHGHLDGGILVFFGNELSPLRCMGIPGLVY